MKDPTLSARFEAAVRRGKAGDIQGRIDDLLALSKDYPQNFGVPWYLGGCLRTAGHVKESVPYLRTAVTLNPNHEHASRNLFHFLWALGDIAGAIDELQRFLSRNESELYSGIREALITEGLLTERPRF